MLGLFFGDGTRQTELTGTILLSVVSNFFTKMQQHLTPRNIVLGHQSSTSKALCPPSERCEFHVDKTSPAMKIQTTEDLTAKLKTENEPRKATYSLGRRWRDLKFG